MAVAANSRSAGLSMSQSATPRAVTWVERLALDKLDALRASSGSNTEGRAGRVRLVLSQ